MYSGGTGIVYGFHGCDKAIGHKIINQEISLKKSENTYDWLGNGMYFWENSPSRALEYAHQLKDHPERSKKTYKNSCCCWRCYSIGKLS